MTTDPKSSREALVATFDRHRAEEAWPEAIECAVQIARLAEDADERARWALLAGLLSERLRDWAAAAGHYARSREAGSSDRRVRYFAENNAGYCHVMLNDPAAAERHCRAAIAIDNTRHNAHKNLALSLQDLGRHHEAALHFIEAIRRYPPDGRAQWHLEILLQSHPALLDDPELRAAVAWCRRTTAEIEQRVAASVFAEGGFQQSH